jgi:hypothetical protein
MAHGEDFKTCLQQHVAVNCCQSSNLVPCGRLFSNDEPNTEPFRESNRTAATYMSNDEKSIMLEKKQRTPGNELGSVTLKAALTAGDHKFLSNSAHLRHKTVGLPVAT